MFRFSLSALLGAALVLSACADPAMQAKVDELDKKVAELTTQLEEVKKAPPAGGAAAKAAVDQEAMNLLKAATEAQQKGDTEGAKANYKEVTEKYAGSRPAAVAARQLAELNVVGKAVDKLNIETWYQGETTLADSKATLLVFWEVWCPHCKREVPKLQATYDKFKGDGLGVIGLTKLTRNKTPEDVTSFMSENKVGYPMAKEAGDMSAFFGVNGVPAAAAVKDGKVVWRGHPAQLTDDMIKAWL